MGIFIVPIFFLLLLGWLLHGAFFAPSQKQQTRVERKFYIPAHYEEESEIYWAGMSGMPTEELTLIPLKYYLVVTIGGEEDYLEVEKKVWDKTSPGDDVGMEISFLLGFLPHVRSFQVAGNTLTQEG